MRHVLVLAAALILAAQIDQPAAQTNTLQLSEQDKAAVIKAAMEDKSRQKTPKEFTPAVGASVPRSVFRHSFKPEVVREVPALKEYWYAYLDREIVLMDGLERKVVAVIPLPAQLVSGDQEHQGAAEPQNTGAKGGPSTTGSVPAYTSPETIK